MTWRIRLWGGGKWTSPFDHLFKWWSKRKRVTDIQSAKIWHNCQKIAQLECKSIPMSMVPTSCPPKTYAIPCWPCWLFRPGLPPIIQSNKFVSKINCKQHYVYSSWPQSVFHIALDICIKSFVDRFVVQFARAKKCQYCPTAGDVNSIFFFFFY